MQLKFLEGFSSPLNTKALDTQHMISPCGIRCHSLTCHGDPPAPEVMHVPHNPAAPPNTCRQHPHLGARLYAVAFPSEILIHLLKVTEVEAGLA